MLLENLQADLEKLGIDESELPEDKPIKFKHLSESIDLQKLKQMSMAVEDVESDKVVHINLYHGNACLNLKIVPGANGTVVLHQAVQKCAAVGPLDDFNLFLLVNDKEKKMISEKIIPYELIKECGIENCKLILEKGARRELQLTLALSKGDYFLPDSQVHICEGDMFYVLEGQGPIWRVKPISRNGKDFDVPRDYLELDPEGWKKLQYKYGQKVYFDKGEAISGPKSSKLAQLKSFTSKVIKNVQTKIEDFTAENKLFDDKRNEK